MKKKNIDKFDYKLKNKNFCKVKVTHTNIPHKIKREIVKKEKYLLAMQQTKGKFPSHIKHWQIKENRTNNLVEK